MELEQEESEHISTARDWIKGHFAVEPDKRYGSIDGKLRVIDTILSRGWVTADETWKLQALGVAFGDALAQKLNLNWVTVEDEYGRDPALNYGGTTLLCFPMTMISKRMERGEAVDILQLFDLVAADIDAKVSSGRF